MGGTNTNPIAISVASNPEPAINQAPKESLTGLPVIDDLGLRLRMFCAKAAIPATHLLRQVFETARDYASAVEMLSDTREMLGMPALFTLSGMRPEEGCVVEARGSERIVHRARKEDGWVTGCANAWLGDWAGAPRLHSQ